MSVSPFLWPPSKVTEEVDFGPSLRDFLRNNYEEDPNQYTLEIATLNRLRQDMRGAKGDLLGRDVLYRYFGQLDFLDLRFPINEHNVKILFSW
jgi:tyrosine-protein phosphatase non-receptor type 23